MEINMDVTKLSPIYHVRELNENDIDTIYNLSKDHTLFYQYCPPFVTKQSIREDLHALPPGKTETDKFYIGYFNQNNLVAVMDLILAFPDDETAFIGLFMINPKYQGDGIGSKIIEDASVFLKSIHFNQIRLAFAKGNPQSEAFWLKNNFLKTGAESENEGYTAVVMQRDL